MIGKFRTTGFLPSPNKFIWSHCAPENGYRVSHCYVVRSFSKPIVLPDGDIIWLVADEKEAGIALNRYHHGGQDSGSELRVVSSDRCFGIRQDSDLFFMDVSGELKDRYIECDQSSDASNLVCTVVESRLSAKQPKTPFEQSAERVCGKNLSDDQASSAIRHYFVDEAGDPKTTVCLPVADYYLWAIQRLYERREDRFAKLDFGTKSD